MAAKKRRKPWLKFPKRMQKKLIVMFSAIAVLLTGLIGRLMYIEYTSGDKYEKIVLSQQEYDSRPFRIREAILWTARARYLQPVSPFIMSF